MSSTETPGGATPQDRDGMPDGVTLQAYLRSFTPGGMPGLHARIPFLRDVLGIEGFVSQPVTRYLPDSLDGPYSPFDHATPDPEFGGRDGVRGLNEALHDAGIVPIGDFVQNHVDEQSPLVRRVFDDPGRWGSWFRLTDNPAIVGAARDKVNIFGGDNWLLEPELGACRASTFRPDQWEFNFDDGAVKEYLFSVARLMIEDWRYGGLRLDAAAYGAGLRLETRTGEHEPVVLEFDRVLRRRLREIPDPPGGRRPFTLAESGGFIEDIARWLDVADAAYDFVFMPALLQSISIGEWGPLQDYWSSLPPAAGKYVRMGGSHDERQLRYSEYKDDLVARYGGRDGEFVCFGGQGLTLPLRGLLRSKEAFMLHIGRTILTQGPVVLYQTDIGGWAGAIHASALDERDPNRCLVPWDDSQPRAGWGDQGRHPLEPTWETQSIRFQLADPHSVLSQVRRLIQMKRTFAALRNGERSAIRSTNPTIDAVALTPRDGATIVEVANASADESHACLDLGRWKGRTLSRIMIDDPRYTVDGPTLLRHPRTYRITGREHAVGLRGHEHAVYEVVLVVVLAATVAER